jgi:transketolase
LSKAGVDVSLTIKGLGGNPEDPFHIFPAVKALYADRLSELSKNAAKRKAEQADWSKKNPALAKKLESFFSGKAPAIDYSKNRAKAWYRNSRSIGCSFGRIG